jgi:hypothetical protein
MLNKSDIAKFHWRGCLAAEEAMNSRTDIGTVGLAGASSPSPLSSSLILCSARPESVVPRLFRMSVPFRLPYTEIGHPQRV